MKWIARHCPVVEENAKAESLSEQCAIQTTLNDISSAADTSSSPAAGARKVSQ
jgi:hypothetical protein